MSDLNSLKTEANELGITFHPATGATKLKGLIEDHYNSIESPQVASIDDDVVVDTKSSKPPVLDKRALAASREKAARETKVVTIVDNDQRENAQTTGVTVNCTCMAYDLGTVILPLNAPVEVTNGHLAVLQGVKISHYMRDPKSGLTSIQSRSRYSISLEANKLA